MADTYPNTTTTGYTIMGTGLVVEPDTIKNRPRESRSLIETRAVQLLNGWSAQVIVGGRIVWEMPGYLTGDLALEAADRHLLDALGDLLA